MLKKTGGLSFKPKAGRRPGGPSKPIASATSASTTRSPTTEPQSQASTPTASHPSTPAVVHSIEPAIEETDKTSTPTASLPHSAPLQTPPVHEPRKETSPAQQRSNPVAPVASSSLALPPNVAQKPTPQPSEELVRDPALRPEPQRPVTGPSRHDAQPTLSIERENNPPETANTSSQPPSATVAAAAAAAAASTSATTLAPPGLDKETAPNSSITPRSPLSVPDPAIAPSRPNEGTASRPPRAKRQTPRGGKSNTTAGEPEAEGPTPNKKRRRRKSSAHTAIETNDVATPETQRSIRRRKREPTPENAEELTVDHSTMTVGELTKDLGIGKRFKHAEEIEQRAREARAKYRLKRLERQKQRLGILPPEDEDPTAQPDTPGEAGETPGAMMAQLGASMSSGGQGVGYDVVDGQIVVHAASLVVDRHNRDMSNLEEVEENDFTNLVNSASFAKRVQAPGNWTEEDTEKFYRLLGMFGTDFETISRLFPGKNRRAIKLKFNKEERLRPNRINAAMMVRGQKKVNIDIEEYKATQRQWQAKDKILEEHARLAQEHEREVARLREERRAAGLIDDDDDRTRNTDTNTTAGSQGSEGTVVIEEDADVLGQGGQGTDGNMDAHLSAIEA
jgi:transcription factor TFIIIB component B''